MAKQSSVQTWIDHKLRHEMRLSWLAAAGLLVAGALVCYLTYWAYYVALIFLASMSFEAAHRASLGLVAGSFVLNAFVDREQLESYRFNTDAGASLRINLARVAGFGGMAALAGGIDNAASFFRLLLVLLLAGPGILWHAVRMARAAWRMSRIDREFAGRLMRMLLKTDGRVPFAKIESRFAGIDLEEAIAQFATIDGVVPVNVEPAGLTLTPGLRDEFAEWRGVAAIAD